MSEQGWQEFLGAKGLDDWVVLHGGATWPDGWIKSPPDDPDR